MRDSGKRNLRAAFLGLSAGVLLFGTGCLAGEAIIDGAYGGISDTVAGIISGVLLGVLGV